MRRSSFWSCSPVLSRWAASVVRRVVPKAKALVNHLHVDHHGATQGADTDGLTRAFQHGGGHALHLSRSIKHKHLCHVVLGNLRLS
jgi:hypothetical protein